MRDYLILSRAGRVIGMASGATAQAAIAAWNQANPSHSELGVEVDDAPARGRRLGAGVPRPVDGATEGVSQ